MATTRKQKRGSRLEQIANTPEVRRSPRLSQRLARREDTFLSITHSATLRPSLKGYNKPHEVEPLSVLNESGQSVPLSFDMDDDNRSKNGDHSEHTATGLPQHLFGLDDSDKESTCTDAYQEPRAAQVLLTPIRQPPSHTAPGLLPRIIEFFMSVLYKCGSLMYLAATAILCFDVILLHRVFHSGVSVRSFARYWVLPLMLFGIVLFLLGGNLIPGDDEPHIAEPTFDPNVNYSDLSVLQAELIKFISVSLEKELSTLKTTLKAETQQHVNRQVELALLDSESKLNSLVKEQVDEEAELRQKNLTNLKNRIRDEVNTTLEFQMAVLKGALDVQFDSLLDKIEIMKKEWIDEANQMFKLDINDSSTSLNIEMLKKMEANENQIRQQLSALDSSLMSEVASLKSSLQSLREQQQNTSSELSTFQLNMERQIEQIGDVKQWYQSELSTLNKSYMGKLQELKAAIDNSGSVNASLVTTIFDKELNKMLANKSSSLRTSLAEAYATNEKIQSVEDALAALKHMSSGGGISRSEAERLIYLAVEKYSADTIGKFDFALESAGGTVLLNKCSKSYTPSLATVTLLGIPLWHVSSTPKVIIQPQSLPGNCWAFQGDSGYATLKLKDEIVITGVSVDHIPKQLTPNGSLSSAPKDFSVFGLKSPDDDENSMLLGTFVYTEGGPAVQEFSVEEMKQKVAYQFVKFHFNSNYGNQDYTCIYRLRVHGHYLS